MCDEMCRTDADKVDAIQLDVISVFGNHLVRNAMARSTGRNRTARAGLQENADQMSKKFLLKDKKLRACAISAAGSRAISHSLLALHLTRALNSGSRYLALVGARNTMLADRAPLVSW